MLNVASKGNIVVNELGHCKRRSCEEPNWDGLQKDFTQNNSLTARNLKLRRSDSEAGIM